MQMCDVEGECSTVVCPYRNGSEWDLLQSRRPAFEFAVKVDEIICDDITSGANSCYELYRGSQSTAIRRSDSAHRAEE